MKSGKLTLNTTLSSTLNSQSLVKTPKTTSSRGVDFIEALWGNNDQLRMDEETKQIIDRKAQIFQMATKNIKLREATMDLYKNYNFNPLLAVKPGEREKALSELKWKNTELVTLIDVMGNVDEIDAENVQIIKKNKNEMTQLKHGNELLSAKIQNTTKKQKKPSYFPSRKAVEEPYDPFLNEADDDLYKYDIQKIASIKQQSFFNKQNSKVNIFQIIKNDQNFLTLTERLQTKNFSFNAIIEKIPPIKINFYRDMSMMGRGLITGSYKNIEQVVNQFEPHELVLDFSYLGFYDIMGIASNRMSPQMIERVFPEDPIGFEKGDLPESDDGFGGPSIIYARTMQNRMENHDNNLQIKEIEDYTKLSFTPEEIEQAFRLQNLSKQLLNTIQFQSTLFQNRIKQSALHEHYTERISTSLLKYLGGTKNQDQIEKIVRFNKYMKDRRDLILIRELKKILEQKNMHTEYQDQLGKFSKMAIGS